MMSLIFSLLLFAFGDGATPGEGSSIRNVNAPDSISFYDGLAFDIVGKYHGEKSYIRFPVKYKTTLRKEVWELGENSAGVSIRFRTNASTIMVRWTVMGDNELPHMPATGVKGVDLYSYVNNEWQYVKTGFPKGKTTEQVLLSKGDGQFREYLLNLPLYDGVDSLKIGINRRATISKPKEQYLLDKKPVVYYGTSIAQGGCASRPGMVFTGILSRKLGRPFINLGFSGNGTIETSVGEAMCEIDAALFVIDCNPNTDKDLIYDRTIELVKMLKGRKPEVPVLLVEGFLNESSYFNDPSHGNENIIRKRMELKRAYETLKKSGVSKLFYQKGDGLIGEDHEGTVDGIHPTDVGMMRIAEALLPIMNKLL
jgi:hypothetical protein